MRKKEKPANMKKALARLMTYMGRYRVALIAVAITALMSTAFSVVGPKIMGRATNELASGIMAKVKGTGGIDFEAIAHILLITLAVYCISALFNLVQGLVMTHITQKLCYGLRREISEKINRMPVKYFEERSYGEVLSRITNDVDTLGQGLNTSVTQLITSFATIVGVVIMMLSISPLMTIISMVILPVSAGLISILVKISRKHFRNQQKYLGKVNGLVEESYGGQTIVRAFSMEQQQIEEFEKTNDMLYQSASKSQFFSGLMMPLMTFVGNLGYGAVVISGGMLAIGGTIGIGDIQAFLQYIKSFNQPLRQIAQVINQVQTAAAASERVFEFLEAEEEEEREESNQVKNIDQVKGHVTMERVAFGYREDEKVINDLSMDIQPGMKVAIVGPTGAGKTTLVKLLMRFYDVDRGRILLDGIDIRKFNRRHLREFFGMVLQDTWLFNGTIIENIRYGNPKATDEMVIQAAKAARAHHFITTLPEGYQMEINEEGTNISRGEKQLITIARAILADNPVLILDEATSSVDTRTENLLQDAMDHLMKGRTSFVIAHRLSTIRDADLILVVKDGDIVEQGNHSQLLNKNGFYAELYNSQFDVHNYGDLGYNIDK